MLHVRQVSIAWVEVADRQSDRMHECACVSVFVFVCIRMCMFVCVGPAKEMEVLPLFGITTVGTCCLATRTARSLESLTLITYVT